MASVNRPNLLFYSRTNNCIELLRMMKQYQLDKEFKIINVDNNKSEVIKKIKVIPTMIIPSINKVIIGEDVNEFVISVINSRIKKLNNANTKAIQKSFNQYSTKITDEQHNKLIDKPILDKSTVNIDNEELKETLNNELNNKHSNKTNPILGYIEDEMGGLSDKYSYLNINISPIHNYGYYQ